MGYNLRLFTAEVLRAEQSHRENRLRFRFLLRFQTNHIYLMTWQRRIRNKAETVTEIRLRRSRDEAETKQRRGRDKGETRQRHGRDEVETRQRRCRDEVEPRHRRGRDKAETR